MLTPKEVGVGIAAPTPIEHSAILESGYTSTGAVATDCTIALGIKITDPDTTKRLCDPTNHYLLTIQKDDAVVKVWGNGTQLADYTGAIGATYAEFLSNVLTEYVGNAKGYYSRLAIIESIKLYTDFWRESSSVVGLYEPKSLPTGLHTLLDFSNAIDLGNDSSGNGNDWTLVSAVQSVDTPTNNYSTINPLTNPIYPLVYTNGMLTVSGRGTTTPWDTGFSTQIVEDKFYAEIALDSLPTSFGSILGVALSGSASLTIQVTGGQLGSWGVQSQTNTLYLYNESATRISLGAYPTWLVNDVICFAIDPIVGNVWVRTNNNAWINGGDPVAGTSPSFTITPGAILLSVTGLYANSTVTCDLGQNGYSFTPPSGFLTGATSDIPDSAYDLSGTYTGNGQAIGPYVYTGCALSTVIIGGVTYDNDGTDTGVVVFTSTGFKMTSLTSNSSGVSYPWTGTLKYPAKTSNAQIN